MDFGNAASLVLPVLKKSGIPGVGYFSGTKKYPFTGINQLAGTKN
jgi:hypothetical protein